MWVPKNVVVAMCVLFNLIFVLVLKPPSEKCRWRQFCFVSLYNFACFLQSSGDALMRRKSKYIRQVTMSRSFTIWWTDDMYKRIYKKKEKKYGVTLFLSPNNGGSHHDKINKNPARTQNLCLHCSLVLFKFKFSIFYLSAVYCKNLLSPNLRVRPKFI